MLARIWGKRTLIHCWRECTFMQLLWKAVWKSLNKLKIQFPYVLAILFLAMYPKEYALEYD
jgi:hypothetical protein